jgi:hypothetical protein
MTKGWFGVDLDGTLAHSDGWPNGPTHVGEPVPEMLQKVKGWLAEGREVRILTARVSRHDQEVAEVEKQEAMIQKWCLKHLGVELKITNQKDQSMARLYDDRAVAVERNSGRVLGFFEDS